MRALTLVLAASSTTVAAPLTTGERQDVDRAVRAERRRQQAVGVAIGVIRDRRIAYLKGYGLADREQRIPVTTETVFNWASNSKPLVAVATMQLVEAGRLDLDADVRRYIPEFPRKALGVVTARRLLAHQSGIPHYRNGEVIPIDPTEPGVSDCESSLAAISRFAGSPLIFSPGERVAYSSHAYVLLSAVAARAGGEQLRSQIEERIAGPLNMRSLTSDVPDTGQRDWAVGYVRREDGEIERAAEYAHCWKHGAGGYKSHVADFAAWAEALLQGRLVSATTQREMWSRQSLASGEASAWGLGFTLAEQGGLKVSHNGSQPETATRMVLYPEAGHGVVVMCNCQYAKPGGFSTAVYKALNQ